MFGKKSKIELRCIRFNSQPHCIQRVARLASVIFAENCENIEIKFKFCKYHVQNLFWILEI